MSLSGIVVAGVACIICLALVGAGIHMRNKSLVDQDEEAESQQNIFLEACDFRRKEAALKDLNQKDGKGNNKDGKGNNKDGKDGKDAKDKDAKGNNKDSKDKDKDKDNNKNKER